MKPDFVISRDVALGVENLADAKKFYVDVMGFSVKSENQDWVQIESKGGAISFYLCADEVKMPAFCLTVPNVERAADHLIANGCELEPDMTQSTGEVFVRDPNGYLYNLSPRN